MPMGSHSLVHFGHRIPPVADSIVEELQECFEAEDTMTVPDRISPGDEVTIGEGAFAGMHAYVLRLMPAKSGFKFCLRFWEGQLRWRWPGVRWCWSGTHWLNWRRFWRHRAENWCRLKLNMGNMQTQDGSWGERKLDLWENPQIEQVRSCLYGLLQETT